MWLSWRRISTQWIIGSLVLACVMWFYADRGIYIQVTVDPKKQYVESSSCMLSFAPLGQQWSTRIVLPNDIILWDTCAGLPRRVPISCVCMDLFPIEDAASWGLVWHSFLEGQTLALEILGQTWGNGGCWDRARLENERARQEKVRTLGLGRTPTHSIVWPVFQELQESASLASFRTNDTNTPENSPPPNARV